MSMTHYMGLLMENSPWNLIVFMAVPVILAETIAITELVLLYARHPWKHAAALNRGCSYLAGLTMTGIACYLIFAAVIPLTRAGEWRGWIDVLAVFAYLAGALPLAALAVINLSAPKDEDGAHRHRGLKIVCVAVFLVVSHVAMIFGMADPALGGYEAPATEHHMTHMMGAPEDHSMHIEHGGDHGMEHAHHQM